MAEVEEVERVVMIDPMLDPDRTIFEGIDTSDGPTFKVGEVGKFFFARSPYWVRWLFNSGKTEIEGKPIVTTMSETGIRTFTLSDVENFAYALAKNGVISGVQLRRTLTILAVQAQMYDFPVLEDQEETEKETVDG